MRDEEERPDIGCWLDFVEANLVTHQIVLWLPEGDCTFMTPAIEYCKGIDPEVTFIQTISGRRWNVQYVLRDGGWKALLPERDYRVPWGVNSLLIGGKSA